MKIAIIGANGRAGSRILAEAKKRGYDVTAIVRNAAKLADRSVPVIEKDVLSLTTADLALFEAVVNDQKSTAFSGKRCFSVKPRLRVIYYYL